LDTKKIGQYLLKKRKEEAKTQKEVAHELGVTYQAVSRWENGDSLPDIETLCMIADMYHVSLDEILQRDGVADEKNYMPIIVAMSAMVYVIAAIMFIVIHSLWIPLVAGAVFIILLMGGAFPANIYYFTQIKDRTKRDAYLYMASYLPAVIGVIIVLTLLL